MECFRGGGGGECKLLSKVPLGIATIVAAPSVAAAVQETSSADEVVALQEIARALKRGIDLLSNNWSWFKVQLSGLAGSFAIAIVTGVIGVTTLYLVDRGRKRWTHWESLRPRPLEDVLTPLTQQLSEQLDAVGVQIAAAAERTATTTVCHANEVAGLRAQVANLQASIDLQMPPTLKDELEPLIAYAKKGAEALDRMAMSTPCVERQLAANVKEVEDLRSAVANLQAQLDAMRIVDVERKEKEMKRKLELIEERLEESEPRPMDVFPDPIEGEVVTAAYVQAAACLTNSSAL